MRCVATLAVIVAGGTAAAAPPAVVAGLFAPRAFTLPYVIEWAHPHTRAKDIAHCFTSSPRVEDGASVVDLACGGEDSDGGVIADWIAWRVIASDRGVWRDDGGDGVAPIARDPADRLFALPARAGRRAIASPRAGDRDRWTRSVRRLGHGVCVDDVDPHRPRFGQTVCFDGTLVGAQYRDAEVIVTLGRVR